MPFSCLSSYMTHPLTTTLPAPVGQQFDKGQLVTCKATFLMDDWLKMAKRTYKEPMSWIQHHGVENH